MAVLAVKGLQKLYGAVQVLRDFAADRDSKSHLWFRWFNEIPVLFLIAAVILVVVKPF